MTFMVGVIIVIENVRSTFTTLDARMIKEQIIAAVEASVAEYDRLLIRLL